MRRTPEYSTALVNWVRNLYGTGQRFVSARQLAIGAGRNPNAVYTIEEVGYASADLLIDLARAVRISPLEALVVGGHLTNAEASPSTVAWDAAEHRFVRQRRDLSHEDRGVLDRLCQQLWATSRPGSPGNGAPNGGHAPRANHEI